MMFYDPATNGFYNPEFGPVPPTASALTELEYQQMLADQAAGKRIEPGMGGKPKSVTPPPVDLATERRRASAAMQAFIEAFLAQFTAGVPQAEIASWPTKAIEARAIIAGTGDSNLIEKEASVTGETVPALAALIVSKAERYSEIIGLVSGLRRKTEATIAAAPNVAAIGQILQTAKASASALAVSVGLPSTL